MGANDRHIIRYSRGTGNNFGKAKNKASSLVEYIKLFSKPTRTKERFKTYLSLSPDEQVELKSIDGWVYRTQIEGANRNAKSGRPSDVFSLDLDFAAPEMPDKMEMGLVLPGLEWFCHSTRRHTGEKPRLRVWGVFSRPVTNEEYGPLSRIIAEMFDPDMRQVDKVSFRKAQMMFLPTTSADGEWFFHRSQGALFDPDAIFETFAETVGDWRDITNLPRVEGEEVREHADKAEDPTAKRGPVGDFCRAYDVIEAIDHFQLPYEPVDENSEKPRFTYTGGTTTSGAVVEDGGLFLYSHHGSDPCADRLVNAFDLVRIHKFSDQDEKVEKGTPINQWPSYKAMVEFIADDPGYKREQAKSKYDQTAMFDDVMDDYFTEEDDSAARQDYDADIEELVGKPTPKPESGRVSPAGVGSRKKRKPPENWFPDALELDKGGNIVQNLPNAQVIIHNDPRLFDAIAYDDFMKRIVLRRDILSKMETVPPSHCTNKVRGDIWQDAHDYTVRAILAAPNGKGKKGYGIDKLAERDLAVAIHMTALRNRFHPIKDYLEGCVHDGVERVERVFIDYLGCPDTPYHRQAARMVLVASVARIFEPGHKFDFSPVLEGEGGIRKSSFIEYLYGRENFGELTCDLKDTKQINETIGGKWSLEFPEMTSFHKSDYNDAKQFLSAKEDTVRMAYDRRTSVFPRQATFWGTTNNTKYLKDPTGNRRWWPIRVRPDLIDTDGLAAARDQIWAEAMAIYRAMRAAQPTGDLPLYLSDPEARREAEELQTRARQRQLYEQWVNEITDWLDQPVSLQQLRNEYGMERMPDPKEPDPEKVMVLRCVTRESDILKHVLREEGAVKNQQVIQNFDSAMGAISVWAKMETLTGRDRAYCFGVRARWIVRVDATDEELKIGYRINEEDLI